MTTASPIRAREEKPSRGRKLLLLLVALGVAIGLIATSGSLAYANHFNGKALPGTIVMGHDVAGKTAEQIASLLSQESTGVTVTVNANGEKKQVSLEELGGSIDTEATAARALKRENTVSGVISAALKGSSDIAPVVIVDPKITEKYAHSLIPEDQTAAVDAQVVKNQESGEFEAIAGRNGKGVDPSRFVHTVQEKASAREDFEVTQEFTEIPPALTTDKADATVEAIDKLLGTSIVVKGPKNKTFEVTRKDRLQFISVAPNDAGDNFEVSINQDAINDYLATMANEIEVSKKDGVTEVYPDGTKKEVSKPVNGLTITNKKDVNAQVSAAITSGKDLEVTFETREVKAEVTEKKVAAEEEKKEAHTQGSLPSYAPAEAHSGKKWIDVNLRKKTVTAYVGDQVVWGPISIVDGKKGNETVTGEYTIYHRTRTQDMGCKPGYDYCTKDVQYNQFFYRGYAFHAAPWRSSFGYSGSHGCINMRVADAKWLWNWASYGTKVVSHH